MRLYSFQYLTILFFVLIFGPGQALSAAENDSTAVSGAFSYSVESGVTLSAGQHTPVWLVSNRHGLGSIQRNNGYLMGGVKYKSVFGGIIDYELGAQLVAADRFEAETFVRQMYFDMRWKQLGVIVGAKIYQPELVNPELSSGELTYSGNALPIPQVRAGLLDYFSVPGTRDWFAIKCHIAYGIFTDGRWQRSFTQGRASYATKVLYHDKSLFIRVGDRRFPLTFEGGLEMPARFSGTLYEPGKRPVKIPHRFKDFWNILFPYKGDFETLPIDHNNILGDMLGSWNVSLKWQLPTMSLRAYYEHQFTDHSQLFFEYRWRDGMWGLEIELPRNPFVSTIVGEYIYSKDQTGPVYHDTDNLIPDQISGSDNYYNHATYSGWQHWGQAIGNPLFGSPVYNNNGSLNFRSNRIIALHGGFCGDPDDRWHYRVLGSYVRHWGTYGNPLDEVLNVWTGMIEVTYRPRRYKAWKFSGAIAADKSSYIGNSLGGMITVTFTK